MSAQLAILGRGLLIILDDLDNGYDHGQPPFGLTFDDNGHYWIPDRESDEFQQALDCIRYREEGLSWRAIATKTGVNKGTARRIYTRRERYLDTTSLDDEPL